MAIGLRVRQYCVDGQSASNKNTARGSGRALQAEIGKQHNHVIVSLLVAEPTIVSLPGTFALCNSRASPMAAYTTTRMRIRGKVRDLDRVSSFESLRRLAEEKDRCGLPVRQYKPNKRL